MGGREGRQGGGHRGGGGGPEFVVRDGMCCGIIDEAEIKMKKKMDLIGSQAISPPSFSI